MVEDLANQLESIQHKQKKEIPADLWQVLAADPEDTFHIPSFRRFLKHVINIKWQSLLLGGEEYNKIIRFYFCVVEESLLSYTFGEQVLEVLVKKLESLENTTSVFQRLLLGMMFRLSDKVVFVEQIQQLVALWAIIDEKILIEKQHASHRDSLAAVYIECAEKYTRNRKLRALISQKGVGGMFVLIKLAIWRKDKLKLAELIKTISLA